MSGPSRAVVAALLAVLVACAPAPTPNTSSSLASPSQASPSRVPSQELPAALTGRPLVPEGTPAWWATRRATDEQDRLAFHQIAATPQGVWFDGVAPGWRKRLRAVLGQADREGAVAQLVLYGIPGRDCGHLSAGGQPDGGAYRSWIAEFSREVGERPVLVVVEPDAVNYCHSTTVRAERAPLLAFVGDTFARHNPNAVLYLHAGAGQLDVDQAAGAVLDAGIGSMRGFALNVAAQGPTAEQEAWGERLVARLAEFGVQERHYVVDTARNGLGTPPNPGASFDTCNSFGAALGTRPTRHTTGAHADAYLWTKAAGESDGVCRPGDPPAGAWYPRLARRVVANALRAGTVEQLPAPRR